MTHQNHEQSDSQSALTINGVAADEAVITYHGSICIQKDAHTSNAMQENKTLLLGSQAKAISIPSLEVKNNDVQCAHGSAVGPLQEDQLMYAQSRGISYDNARRLLLTSFFAQSMSGMLNKTMQEVIVARLVAKILGEKRII
jgi:Fe-S cluster assembly protein SufD